MDYGALIGGIAKGVNSYGTAEASNSDMQRAYQQMLAQLQAQYAGYDALGSAGYQNIAPQQLGPSALEGIQDDPQARAAQQQSMAALQELADKGGLSLADMKALNDIQANLNQNDASRRQGLANQYAARGQLGAGAQLAMDLSNQQNAATNANNAGESAAAQAQARALQAILEKGKVAGSMNAEDYRRKAAAAQAHDLIEQRNAAARTDAGKYNNTIAGQQFEDQLAKQRGKTAIAGSMNDVVMNRGTQSARTTAAEGGYRNDLIDQFGNATKSGGGTNSGGGSSTGSTLDNPDANPNTTDTSEDDSFNDG